VVLSVDEKTSIQALQRTQLPLPLRSGRAARHTHDYKRVRGVRGPVASAFRQRDALRHFLDDGRLRLENNSAERELRSIATGRRSWFFMGSDDHAQAAANIFSLVASCKLHNLDVEAYLAEIICVMPYWPHHRYLELAPKYWARTRARLDPRELELALGHVTVPPPAQ
jgi:transposase